MRCAARFLSLRTLRLYSHLLNTNPPHKRSRLTPSVLASPYTRDQYTHQTLSLSPVIIPKLHNLPRRIAPIDTKLTARLVKLRLKISDFIPILIAEDRITEAAYRRAVPGSSSLLCRSL